MQYALSRSHHVIGISRNPQKNPALVSEIESRGGKFLKLDVTAPETEIQASIKQAEAIYGHIDVLVNNAGYAVMGALENVSDRIVTAQMEANFLGPLRIMRSVLPGMRKRRSGVVINISSAQGLCPSPGNGIYAASKAALEAASESLSEEVASLGIRVLIVEPGAFRTNFADSNSAVYVQPTEEYAEESHPVAQRLSAVPKLAGTAIGDPDKAAKVLFETATGTEETGSMIKEQKLLRVIIGPDCWKRADAKVSELRRTVDLMKEVAESTSFSE